MPSDLPPGWNIPASAELSAPLRTQNHNNPEGTVWVYAGFWWRVCAFMIDAIIIEAIDFGISLIMKPKIQIKWRELSLPGFQGGGGGADITNVSNLISDSASVLVPHLHTEGLRQFYLLTFIVFACYCIFSEASSYQGTPGMRLCRIEVVTTAGKRISIARATARFFIKNFVSIPLFFIGVIMVGLTPRKQGLHDLVTDTLVIRRRRRQDVIFTQHS